MHNSRYENGDTIMDTKKSKQAIEINVNPANKFDNLCKMNNLLYKI